MFKDRRHKQKTRTPENEKGKKTHIHHFVLHFYDFQPHIYTGKSEEENIETFDGTKSSHRAKYCTGASSALYALDMSQLKNKIKV